MSRSFCHGAALLQVSFEIAFLDEAPVAMLTVEGLLAAVHADVSSDAEDLGVCLRTEKALQNLIRSV